MKTIYKEKIIIVTTENICGCVLFNLDSFCLLDLHMKPRFIPYRESCTTKPGLDEFACLYHAAAYAIFSHFE